MNARTKIKITAKNQQSENNTKIAIIVVHRLTREDLDDFVREQGYDNYESYFSTYIKYEDVLNDIYENIKDNCIWAVEPYIQIDCDDAKALKKFILKKYQATILQNFMDLLLTNFSPRENTPEIEI